MNMQEDSFWRELADIAERLARLFRHRHHHHHYHPNVPPSAPRQTVQLNQGSTMATATIVDVLPTTRQDGSALAITDIASITFQKASLAGSPPVLGAPVVLATNSAASGGLTTAQLTFVDPTPLPGDSYTSFVTDVQGHIGQASSPPFVVPATLSPPSAPTQTVTLA
jgi:hypothetical protein